METALGVVLGVGLGALIGVGTAAGMAEAAYRRGWRDAERRSLGTLVRAQPVPETGEADPPVIIPPGETITLN